MFTEQENAYAMSMLMDIKDTNKKTNEQEATLKSDLYKRHK